MKEEDAICRLFPQPAAHKHGEHGEHEHGDEYEQ
jgi:hypothetical protein